MFRKLALFHVWLLICSERSLQISSNVRIRSVVRCRAQQLRSCKIINVKLCVSYVISAHKQSLSYMKVGIEPAIAAVNTVTLEKEWENINHKVFLLIGISA